MPLSLRDFDQLPLAGQPADLAYRIMEFLQQHGDAAYSAEEIAGALLGHKGWAAAFSPRVAELLPSVRQALGALVEDQHLEFRVRDGLAGPEKYYRRKG